MMLFCPACGHQHVDAEAPAAALMAGMFMGMFDRAPDAKNYIECLFYSPQGEILVTVTRPGGKTPHQLRREAEARLSAAAGTIACYRTTGDGPVTPNE